MGRKYGLGKYGRATYDLGGEIIIPPWLPIDGQTDPWVPTVPPSGIWNPATMELDTWVPIPAPSNVWNSAAFSPVEIWIPIPPIRVADA